MTRFALLLEYDGTPFMGLQRQPTGPTVQAAIEAAVLKITGEMGAFAAAGRTDAGVHALGMRAQLDIQKAITPFRLMEALNALLRPAPIAVLDCVVVAGDWHARFSCTERAYQYRIANRRAPLTLERDRAWQVRPQLDEAAMHRAAQALVGTHDFTTFRSVHCQSASPLKSLDLLDIERVGDEVHVHAAARSFLHHQVRSITGCLGLVGIGQWSPGDMKAALGAKDRTALGLNAPPEGLYFVEASYHA